MTAAPLRIPDHMHTIEYYLELDRDHRKHVYTETVDDHGFVFVHDPEKREQWLADYTRTCALDYLARVRAKSGRWLVHVYRLIGDERRHLVSIRLRWPAGSPE